MRSSPPAKGRNPYLRASSLAEIISWDDIDFVRVAYLTVLGREPDAEGEAYYTNRIREGHSKLELLWQLRSSEEGAQYDPGIAGLDRALRSAAWARHRLFGPFVRLVTSNNEGRRRDNQHRAIMNQLTLLRNEQWIHRHLLDSLSGRLRELVVAVPERKEEPTRPAVSTALYVKPVRTLSAQEVARQSLDSRERHVLDLLEAQA